MATARDFYMVFSTRIAGDWATNAVRTRPAGSRAPRNPGARRPGSRSVLSRYGGLQPEADDAEGERHTRSWICSPRQAKHGRGNRQVRNVETPSQLHAFAMPMNSARVHDPKTVAARDWR